VHEPDGQLDEFRTAASPGGLRQRLLSHQP
jgi:hypothetical protein